MMRGHSSQDVAYGAVFLAAIALGAAFVIPFGIKHPTVSHDQTALGTWYNMPSLCPSQDQCMLFGNQSLVQILPFDGVLSAGAASGTIAAYLSIGCLAASVSVNDAYLQLQYAMYNGQSNVVQGLGTNATNWENISRVYINSNGTYTPCNYPFNVLTGAVDLGVQLNATAIGWVFRVIGANGGGQGDNPRFTFINIELENYVKRVATITPFTPSTTAFSYAIEVTVPFTANTAITFQWIATNITSTGCGLGSNKEFHCFESGVGTCTFTLAGSTGTTAGQCPGSGSNSISFVTAFTGTVRVTAVTKNNLAALSIPFGSLNLFSSQPITV